MYNYNNKGYYEVNHKTFANKLEAIVYANEVGWKGIKWNFNDDLWNKQQFTIEPTEDLLTLYKERAQQLRDEYDRIVVFVSGGADSTAVLQSFINNNIRIDDIFIFGAFSAEENVIGNLSNDDYGYFTRETELLAKPLIKQALQKQPHINVIEWDWTDFILSSFDDLDWIWKVGGRFSPNMRARSNFHKVYKKHQRLEENGTKIAFIFGVDKPRLMRDDSSIYLVFNDSLITTGSSISNDILEHKWEHDEFFFWSVNSPKIIIKQAHQIINFIHQRKLVNTIPHISHDNNVSWHHTTYYGTINPIIYPEWNQNIWQIEKPTSPTYNEMERWFFASDHKSLARWKGSIDEVSRIVGSGWLNRGEIYGGLTGNLSPLYKIADIPKVIS